VNTRKRRSSQETKNVRESGQAICECCRFRRKYIAKFCGNKEFFRRLFFFVSVRVVVCLKMPIRLVQFRVLGVIRGFSEKP
jgi:hypothetical protein